MDSVDATSRQRMRWASRGLFHAVIAMTMVATLHICVAVLDAPPSVSESQIVGSMVGHLIWIFLFLLCVYLIATGGRIYVVFTILLIHGFMDLGAFLIITAGKLGYNASARVRVIEILFGVCYCAALALAIVVVVSEKKRVNRASPARFETWG